MMYYSEEARRSAINDCFKCIKEISKISGKELTYDRSASTIKYLSDYIKVLEKESKQQLFDKITNNKN